MLQLYLFLNEFVIAGNEFFAFWFPKSFYILANNENWVQGRPGRIEQIVLFKSPRNSKRHNKGNFTSKSDSNKIKLCEGGGNIILF